MPARQQSLIIKPSHRNPGISVLILAIMKLRVIRAIPFFIDEGRAPMKSRRSRRRAVFPPAAGLHVGRSR